MSLFKQHNQNAAQLFGGSAFGGNKPSGDNNTSVTGISNSPQDRLVRPSSSSLFAKKLANTSTSSQPSQPRPNTVSAQSFFANAVNKPSNSLFGKTTSTQSAFGGNSGGSSGAHSQMTETNLPRSNSKAAPIFNSSENSKPKTLFGKKVQSPASHSTEDYTRYYSALTDLTPDELAAFKASKFTFGCIPLKLPPYQLCAGS
ncbi:nucleoporin NUP42-like [Watersipora subatra]|uniref:nucleoporin NUP42-like n=1 Tax=Watersipora subatra TaxID=2589382 RepID=UPI00355C0269